MNIQIREFVVTVTAETPAYGMQAETRLPVCARTRTEAIGYARRFMRNEAGWTPQDGRLSYRARLHEPGTGYD